MVKLKTSEADRALHLAQQEATLIVMDTHTVNMVELQEQLTPEAAKTSELLSRNGDVANELRLVETQNAAGGRVSDD